MLISRNWLQTFFDTELPSAAELGDALTFHSSEVEEIKKVGDDDVLDVSVLPDKSPWLLSHRGFAKELSVILGLSLSRDPLQRPPKLAPKADSIKISLHTKKCTRYIAAHIKGVSVGESPEWLQTRLTAIGQKPINSIVDAANYVMFTIGQPLHAFDAGKLAADDEQIEIGVRMARDKEEIVALTGEPYSLSGSDMLIVDGADVPIGIAGIKGGKQAEVDADTTELLIESANFDRVAVRKSAQHLKLRTDASMRYENGVVPAMTAYGIAECIKMILEISGGTLVGYQDTGAVAERAPLIEINRREVEAVLGARISDQEICNILDRFGHSYAYKNSQFQVSTPFERSDLVIKEDLIEEIGRIHGYEHILDSTPEPIALRGVNKRFYYSEMVREVLAARGFSEVFTSSFRSEDTVGLKNAFASDKGCLRSNLASNIDEVLTKNMHNKDLLGLQKIMVFEMGTVFPSITSEYFSLAVGVRTKETYSEKEDKEALSGAIAAVEAKLKSGKANWLVNGGIAEINLDGLLKRLPDPKEYQPFTKEKDDITYQPFSVYPHVSRDIALWTSSTTQVHEVEEALKEAAGDLLMRITLFDTFEKEGRISYAFRLVFQSKERTLTDREVNMIMDDLNRVARKRRWEVR